VQSLGVKGRGKHWVVVTSQEKLGELVSGLDDKKIELARLMDRFPLQVHLEPSDISEVTSRACSRRTPPRRPRSASSSTSTAVASPSTRASPPTSSSPSSREAFIDLYPLLPYQIDLIIQVVSGCARRAAPASTSAARTAPSSSSRSSSSSTRRSTSPTPVGDLVRLDQVYDLVEGNIGSEVRAKIAAIEKEVPTRSRSRSRRSSACSST
jgi:hypothetical protein